MSGNFLLMFMVKKIKLANLDGTPIACQVCRDAMHILGQIILIVVLAIIINGCSNNSTYSSNYDSSSRWCNGKTPECQLVTLEERGPVLKDDVRVIRSKYLLDSLASKTVNSREHIAAYTYNTQQVLLKEYGVKVTTLELMESLNKIIPTGGNTDYHEAIAAYALYLKDV